MIWFLPSLLFVSTIVSAASATRSELVIGPYTVSLASDGASGVLGGGASTSTVTFALPHRASVLHRGGLSPTGRVTVIARDNESEQLIVLAPEAGKLLGIVRAASAAISADGRFAVWARHSSGNTVATSAEFYAATVDELPVPASNAPAGLPGRLVYPEPSSGLHVLASNIERVDDSTFAFLDFSQQARATRVVVVRLSASEAPVVVAKPLNPSDLAEMSGTSAATPGKPAISRVDGEGLALRIDFAPVSADAQGRTATIRMW